MTLECCTSARGLRGVEGFFPDRRTGLRTLGIVYEQIQRLSTASNLVVVQLPERAHPGVVLQGDSLRNITGVAKAAVEHLRDGDVDEGLGLAEETANLLEGYLAAFEAALKRLP